MSVSAIRAIEHGHEVILGVLCDATADIPSNVKDEAVAEFFLKLGDWIIDTEACVSYYIADVGNDGAITLQAFSWGGGSGGGSSASVGFGTPTATAATLEAGAQATAEVTASGPDSAKILDFKFGIPKGDKGDIGVAAGFGNITVTVNTLDSDKEATGSVGVSGDDTAKNLAFILNIPRGDKGETGEGFSIYKTYGSVDEMNADAANVEEGKFVLIASDVEDEDNAKLYVKGAETFAYLTDLSGAQGIKGEDGATPTFAIGNVTTGEAGTDVSVEITGTAPNYVLNITIPKGEKGDAGTDAVFKILTVEPSTSDVAEGEVAFVVET